MTKPRLRTLTIPLAALLAALVLSACGSTHQPTTRGDSEGAYIQAGPLVYQVQLSRELNPSDVADRQFLAGLPAGTPKPAGDEEWFGVWLRVQNPTSRSAPLASDFKIVDTLGNTYTPIRLPASNVTSYQPRELQGTDGQNVEPNPDNIAGAGPIQGSMLLFKLNTSVYANRPLELEITPPGGGAASTVELDL